MRDLVRVSAIQFRPAFMDADGNLTRMEQVVREEREHGSDLVVFPELAVNGYMPHPNQDLSLISCGEMAETAAAAAARAQALSDTLGVHIVLGVLRPADPGAWANSAILTGPARPAEIFDKWHLFPGEEKLFRRGETLGVAGTDLGVLGLQVCYDTRFPELTRCQVLAGAEIIVSIWATFHQGDREPLDSVQARCSVRAAESASYFVGCNRVGNENGLSFYGRSGIAAPTGHLLAAAPDDAETVLRATLDGRELARQRAYIDVRHRLRVGDYMRYYSQVASDEPRR